MKEKPITAMSMDNPQKPPSDRLPTYAYLRSTGEKVRIVSKSGSFLKVTPINRKTSMAVHENHLTYKNHT